MRFCVCVQGLKAGCVVLPGAERFYEARRSFNAVFLLAKADITGETKWNSGTVDWLWTLCVVGSVCCGEFVIIFSENSKSEISCHQETGWNAFLTLSGYSQSEIMQWWEHVKYYIIPLVRV